MVQANKPQLIFGPDFLTLRRRKVYGPREEPSANDFSYPSRIDFAPLEAAGYRCHGGAHGSGWSCRICQ